MAGAPTCSAARVDDRARWTLRTALTAPLTPVVLLALAAAGAFAGELSPATTWVLLGLVAGYSLSGSP